MEVGGSSILSLKKTQREIMKQITNPNNINIFFFKKFKINLNNITREKISELQSKSKNYQSTSRRTRKLATK